MVAESWTAILAHQPQRYAIEPKQQFDITKGKNATDMKIVIVVMNLLYSRQVDGLGIMSSESDFIPVAMRLCQSGLPVYGFGTDRAPEDFRETCTRFFDLGALAQQAQSADDKPAPANVDAGVVVLLSEGWKASKRDEKGFASLSEVGQRASSHSWIDARNHGFTRLSELVASLPRSRARSVRVEWSSSIVFDDRTSFIVLRHRSLSISRITYVVTTQRLC